MDDCCMSKDSFIDFKSHKRRVDRLETAQRWTGANVRNVVVLMEGLMKRQHWCNGGSGRMGLKDGQVHEGRTVLDLRM